MNANGLFPNTTQVPNVILDRWLPHLSGSELKVVMYVCRRTYGFGKEQDCISLSQMADGISKRDGTILDYGAGLSKSAAAAACKSLAEKGVLGRTSNTSQNGGPAPTGYHLNLQREPGKKTKGSAENGQGGSPKIGQGVVQRLDTQNQVEQKEVKKDLSNDKSKESDLSLPSPKKLRADRKDNERKWEALLEEDENAATLKEFAHFLAEKNKDGTKLLSALWNHLGEPFLDSVGLYGRAATIAGMKTAMQSEKRSFAYAKGVAKDWKPDNVTPINSKPPPSNAPAADEEHKRRVRAAMGMD